MSLSLNASGPLRTISGDPTLLFCLLLAIIWMSGCARPESKVEKAIREGVLLVGNDIEPESLDPHFTTSVSAIQIQQAIFEGLVVPNPQTLAPEAGVADRWEISEDGLLYRFHIRNSAKWSDGTPVRAEDFRFAWLRMLSPSGGSPNTVLFDPINGATEYSRGTIRDTSKVGVQAVAENLLEIRLRHPAGYFLSMLTHPVFSPQPKWAIEQGGSLFDRGNKWIRPENFVGNGPFMLEQWKPDQMIRVIPNPHYWDRDQVALNAIEFYPIDDEGTEERAFQAGQLHVTENVPPSHIQSYQSNNPEVLQIDPYYGVYYLLLNHRRPPLDSKQVRLDLSAAIDREVICNQLFSSGLKPAYSFTPPGFGNYSPPRESHSPLSDIPHLREAPTISFLYNTSDRQRKLAEAIAAMWKQALGTEVQLENVEFRTYLARRSEADFSMARASWIADYVAPESFLELWTSDGAGSEWSGWSSVRYDQLIENASLTQDTDKRLQFLFEAESLLLEEQVMIPIYHYVTSYLKRPEVKGWYPTALDWHPWKYVRLER